MEPRLPERPTIAAERNLATLMDLRPGVGWEGARFTPRRVQNLIKARAEQRAGAVKLSSYPLKVTLEASNVCNLRCPACFTGDEQRGRSTQPMPPALYEPLIDELAPYAFEIEFHNWGEPLLAKRIFDMVRRAHRLGASTTISTNFSLPFDEAKAAALVESGLTVLGVSLDGVSQEVYEQYRRRGDVARVLANAGAVRDAKHRLGSKTPRVVWEYHVFSHNTAEIERARELADELEMDLAVEKGWVVGPDWDTAEAYRFYANPTPNRCHFLWYQAVVNNDGGVAPCCGSFYAEDDLTRVTPQSLQRRSFHEYWNAAAFQNARRLFRNRAGGPALRDSICFECPATKIWERYKEHVGAGGGEAFDVGVTTNDTFNYFWSRRERHGNLVKIRRSGAGGDVEPSR